MPTACDNLFDYATRFITTTDVDAFAPDDPGYPDYVRAFNRILTTHELPVRADFDITETIGLTRWVNANGERDPRRFRRFRTFVNAVGLSFSVKSEAGDDSLPANYSTISLIDDAYALADQDLFRLLRPAFEEFHQVLAGQNSEESPFILLATLLVASQLGTHEHELSAIADRVIDAEGKYSGRASSDFLLGCTFFDQLHERWKWFVGKLVPPTTPSMALLRKAVLAGQSATA